jgi:hypothetical protein
VTINTNTIGAAVWVGKHALTIGGKPVDYVHKADREAAHAARLLSRAAGQHVPVQPAIVFVELPRVTIHRGGPADVTVLTSTSLLRRWLRRRPPACAPDRVTAIHQAARRPASWQSHRPPRG